MRRISIMLFGYLAVIALPSHCSPELWSYYPPGRKAHYGIVMGGTSNMFKQNQGGNIPHVNFSVCLAMLYARRHDYAFYLSSDLASENNRTYGNCTSGQMSAWNKIPLLRKLINDVNIIVWIDLDAILSDDSFTIGLDKFLPRPTRQSDCLPVSSADYFEGIYISRNNSFFNTTPAASTTPHMGTSVSNFNLTDMFGSSDDPFLWAAQDLNPLYAVNLNTAVLAIRRCPLALQFLDDVWNLGNNISYFHRYDKKWYMKPPCEGYWGWPWEQGAIWGLLSEKANSHYRQGTCVRPHRGPFALNTVKGHIPMREISWYFNENEKKTHQYDNVFAYHKIDEPFWARYSLKRLLMRGVVGHERISKICGLHIRAPRYGTNPFS